jgi:hypothetical protein
LRVEQVEALLWELAAARTVVGAGFSGLTADERNLEPLRRFCAALGL